jgi:hypothetical protein
VNAEKLVVLVVKVMMGDTQKVGVSELSLNNGDGGEGGGGSGHMVVVVGGVPGPGRAVDAAVESTTPCNAVVAVLPWSEDL